MFRPRLAMLLLASCFLLIAGCGGGNNNSSTTTTPPASAQLTLSVPSLAFNSVTVGQTSAAQTVTLSSTGGLGVTITSFTLSDTTDYAMSNTCTSQLSLATTCTLSVTFTPKSAASLPATIMIASNSVGSPQTVTLTGTGTTATAAQVTLSTSALLFGSIGTGTPAAAQTVTVTNSGNATLTNLAVALSGSGSSAFSDTTTCTSTLAASASCTVSVVFTAAANASYAASLNLTDSATPSPQTVSLSGSAVAAVTYTLYTFPETDNSVTPLYALINGAQKTIDMTMYALEDTTFSGDLVAACQRGVKVRVILDINDEQSANTPAYNQLNLQTNCSAEWANTAFEATHQKTFTIDDTTTAIMSLNLQTGYYSTTRDFALVENDPVDIAAIEETFNADYAAGTPSSGVQGASDFSYVPGGGDTSIYPAGDLIWSPTTAQADMLSIINNATKTLVVENEEMGAANIVSALEAASQRGVAVHVAMVNDDNEYSTEFAALVAAGCGVNLYPDTTTGFYVHAKAVVADYGLSTQNAYMGSINYSLASMNNNRELGLFIHDPATVTAIETTMAADYAGGTPY